MVAVASRRGSAIKKSSRNDAAFRHPAVVWSILSAVGGAVLLFVGQVAIEEYKGARVAETKADETRLQQKQQANERLDTLFNEYLALGQVTDRAGQYIDTGKGGSKEDLSSVVSHFRKLIAYVVAGRTDLTEVSRLYGGRLAFWRDQLVRLGSGKSPASREFSENELSNFVRVGEGLRALDAPLVPAAASTTAPSRTAATTARTAAPDEESDVFTISPGANRSVVGAEGGHAPGKGVAQAPLYAKDRQALLESARAQGVEIPESTLEALFSSQEIQTSAGPPDGGPPPDTELPPAESSAFRRVLEQQSAARSKDNGDRQGQQSPREDPATPK